MCIGSQSNFTINEVILRDDIVNIDVEVVNKGVGKYPDFIIQNATSKGIILILY